MKKRFTEEQIIGFLKEAGGGVPVKELCRSVIEMWRDEYNHERPKRVAGGLTPVQYARRLTEKVITIPVELRQEDLLAIYRGKLAEQHVAQELLVSQNREL